MHTIFDVRNNCANHGKAFAYFVAREQVGTIQALFMLWTALHMLRHEAHIVGIKY